MWFSKRYAYQAFTEFWVQGILNDKVDLKPMTPETEQFKNLLILCQ